MPVGSGLQTIGLSFLGSMFFLSTFSFLSCCLVGRESFLGVSFLVSGVPLNVLFSTFFFLFDLPSSRFYCWC